MQHVGRAQIVTFAPMASAMLTASEASLGAACARARARAHL
jgi:hypothetical protein